MKQLEKNSVIEAELKRSLKIGIYKRLCAEGLISDKLLILLLGKL